METTNTSLLPKSRSMRNTVIFVDLSRQNSKIHSSNDLHEKDPPEKIAMKLNSPYITEACRRLGYNPAELKKK